MSGNNYRVIWMVKDPAKLAKPLAWDAIDHAVICFDGDCYGWGEVCKVNRGKDGIYYLSHKGVTFFGMALSTGTVSSEDFRARTAQWNKLSKHSESTNYPNNCRGYVDFVIGHITNASFPANVVSAAAADED